MSGDDGLTGFFGPGDQRPPTRSHAGVCADATPKQVYVSDGLKENNKRGNKSKGADLHPESFLICFTGDHFSGLKSRPSALVLLLTITKPAPRMTIAPTVGQTTESSLENTAIQPNVKKSTLPL